MSDTVDAIYDGGVLRPVVPLALPNGARVTLTIGAQPPQASAVAVDLEPRDEWERMLLSASVDCGVSLTDAALSSDSLYE